MNKLQILQITNILKELFEFLYTQKNKNYEVNISWFDNNITTLIQEKLTQKQIFEIKINGTTDDYNFIMEQIINLVINNNDTFGCLATNFTNNIRHIQSQKIKTMNLEITIPIYNSFELLYAENINNIMLDNLNNNHHKEKNLVK